MVYQTLDAVTLGKGVKRSIGGETIRFPAKFSRYYESDYEPETFAFFRKNIKPGMTVLDIGGHMGLFAVMIAKMVGEGGRVFSFEPTPFTRSVLEKVVGLNEVSDVVEVRGEAVSSKSGTAVFYDTGTEVSNANSLVKTGLSKGEIKVPMISVDAFVREKNLTVDCLKIDVEGVELDVLSGAKETFEKFRPVARLGLHPPFIEQNGQTLEEIWNLLQSYDLEIVFENRQVEKDWFCEREELFDVSLFPR
ncbi:MAG: FkbM family methyltransferase [Pyrinomonadaceae bacterium]